MNGFSNKSNKATKAAKPEVDEFWNDCIEIEAKTGKGGSNESSEQYITCKKYL